MLFSLASVTITLIKLSKTGIRMSLMAKNLNAVCEVVNSKKRDSSNWKVFYSWMLTNEAVHRGVRLVEFQNQASTLLQKYFQKCNLPPAFDAFLTFDWNVYPIGFMKTLNQIEAFTY